MNIISLTCRQQAYHYGNHDCSVARRLQKFCFDESIFEVVFVQQVMLHPHLAEIGCAVPYRHFRNVAGRVDDFQKAFE